MVTKQVNPPLIVEKTIKRAADQFRQQLNNKLFYIDLFVFKARLEAL